MVATLASKLTGFIRVQSIADVFGATWHTDAFLTAFLIPECLYLFFTEGALACALIPVFAKYLVAPSPDESRKDAPDAASLMWTLTVIAFLIALPITLAIALGQRYVATALGPGFSTQTQGLAASLLTIVALYIPLGLVGGVFQGYLNARGHFLAPALGPLLFNIVTIAAAYLFGRTYGVHALAYGVVIGGLLALIIQWLALRLFGVSLGRPDFRHPGLGLAARLLLPIIASLVLVQGQVIIERILASSLAPGSIASLNFAQKILNLPAGFLALTISTALMPTLAAAAVKSDWLSFDASARRCHDVLLFLVAPVSLWFFVSAAPIVHLAFRRGAFTLAHAAVTETVLRAFAPALVPMAGTYLLTRLFLARGDAKTPAVVKGIAIAINLGLLGTTLPRWGIVAIPAAFTGMYFVNYILLLIPFFRIAPDTGRSFTHEFGRILLACLIISPVAFWLATATAETTSARITAIIAPGILLAMAFPLLSHILGANATRTIVGFVREKLR